MSDFSNCSAVPAYTSAWRHPFCVRARRSDVAALRWADVELADVGDVVVVTGRRSKRKQAGSHPDVRRRPGEPPGLRPPCAAAGLEGRKNLVRRPRGTRRRTHCLRGHHPRPPARRPAGRFRNGARLVVANLVSRRCSTERAPAPSPPGRSYRRQSHVMNDAETVLWIPPESDGLTAGTTREWGVACRGGADGAHRSWRATRGRATREWEK